MYKTKLNKSIKHLYGSTFLLNTDLFVIKKAYFSYCRLILLL